MVSEKASSARRMSSDRRSFSSSAATLSELARIQVMAAAASGAGSCAARASLLNAHPYSAPRSVGGSGMPLVVVTSAGVTVARASATPMRLLGAKCGHFMSTKRQARSNHVTDRGSRIADSGRPDAVSNASPCRVALSRPAR